MLESGTELSAGGDELASRAAQALEWPRLLAALAERAQSEPGKLRLERLAPASTLEEARARMSRVRVVLELGAAGVELPRSDFSDLHDVLARLRLGGAANGSELARALAVLTQAKNLRQLAKEHGASHPELVALLHSDERLERLALRLAECLEPSGAVLDAASPVLAEARARLREIATELRRRLAELAQRYADVLSGQYYTEREGRYVLPVRADAHYRVEGLVLGSSGSGSTLYVEPHEVTALANRLRVQEASVHRETARVLADLSELLREQIDAVQDAFERCIEADVVGALASWAAATRSCPVDVQADDRFDVHAARHPLLVLAGADVVPNDIVLAGGRALVISGPNAGGKTVALKCLGLFAWMARAGIPIPAGPESRVGWFDRVLADVGDDQSLVRSLSTFSAHVRTLAAILDEAAPRVLVLLDEVAAGTDPEEGAALAASVLEALTARGAAVACTTHYEKLKELAADEGRLQNGSVGFDFLQMQPTFRLTLGVPGASSALAVASRHGLPESLVARARELLPRTTLDRERLLLELDAERDRLARDRSEALTELEEQRKITRALAEEQARLEEAARARVDKETRELLQKVRSLRAELDKARTELQRGDLGRAELRAVERDVSRVAAQIAVGGPLAPVRRMDPPLALLPPHELVPGARVRVRSSGAVGVVLHPPERGQVQLRIGAMRMSHKVEELERAPGNRQTSPSKKAPRSTGTPRLAEARRSVDNTLDLRGVRVEAVPDRLDAFLDRMLGEGGSVGFVLHGHGSGALRTAVREHLGGSSYVEHGRAAEPDEGGEAFTVFWIKE